MKNKIQIILITYNRKNKIKQTLDSVLSADSPIKDYPIIILDNNSTDGTSELINEYCKSFPNLEHIKHKINIGGNGNICRAYETGAIRKKEYTWVLCDDDKYDWSNWKEVEEEIQKGTDIICLSDYVFPENQKENKAYQIFQLTFVPAGIYKTELITYDVITNMYDSIYTMFQQSVLTIKAINNNKKIHVLSKPIVFNGLHYEDKVEDISLTRGYNNEFMSERRKLNHWMLGFSNVLTLLNDVELRKESLEASITYKDICGSWENFYNWLGDYYCNEERFNYFYELYKTLTPQRQQEFCKRFPNNIKNVFGNMISINTDTVETAKKSSPKLINSIFEVRNIENHKQIKLLGIKLKIKNKKYR